MTREERENAIRHINSALDVDEWAKELATEALSVDYDATDDAIKEAYHRGYKDGMYAAGVNYELCVDEWIGQMEAKKTDLEQYSEKFIAIPSSYNEGVDACIAILKGGE